MNDFTTFILSFDKKYPYICENDMALTINFLSCG